MIITKIKSNGTEKLLSIAYRYQGKPFGCWLCDWNTVPNTLRIFHRCTTIDIKFDSFKECCKFIFSMNFIEDAERMARIQENVWLHNLIFSPGKIQP